MRPHSGLRARRRASGVALAWWLACVASCAGKSSDPPPPNDNKLLTCLTTLDSYCCSDAATLTCIGDFATASQCGTWPAGVTVRVYPTACKGMTAVRVDGTWSTFYIYGSTGALMAVGDNAASVQDPRDTTVECGAGAPTFAVPNDCGTGWESNLGATACSAGTPSVAAYCGTH